MHHWVHTWCRETRSLQWKRVVLSSLWIKNKMPFLCGTIIIIDITNLHFIPWSSSICSLYWSSAVWRLAGLSPALNTAMRQELRVEFGWVTLTTCIFILKLPWPLSPPSFTHTSLEGMALLCQVRPLADLIKRNSVILWRFRTLTLLTQGGESKCRQLVRSSWVQRQMELLLSHPPHHLLGRWKVPSQQWCCPQLLPLPVPAAFSHLPGRHGTLSTTWIWRNDVLKCLNNEQILSYVPSQSAQLAPRNGKVGLHC